MIHLIDKSALVAKIDDWRHNIMMGVAILHGHQRADATFEYEILGLVRDFLDTLEVKEVNLDAEIIKWEESFGHCPASMGYKETAKHFYELGLKAQHSALTWEDISVLRKIMAEYRRQTSNEMLVLNDEDYCKEVLNRFKTQK